MDVKVFSIAFQTATGHSNKLRSPHITDNILNQAAIASDDCKDDRFDQNDKYFLKKKGWGGGGSGWGWRC